MGLGADLGGAGMTKETCVACSVPLCKRDIEKHHFPVPKAAGGKETVPLCRSCHNMVHRVPLNEWPQDWSAKAFYQMGREGRLFLMKALYIHALTEFERKAK